MSELFPFARPYASAAYEVAKAEDDIAGWDIFLQTASQIITHPTLVPYLGDPRVSADWLENLLTTLCAPFLNEQRSRYLQLLLKKQRLNVLPAIYDLFEIYRAQQEGRLAVEIHSAFSLQDEQIDTLKTLLHNRFNQKIELTTHVDKQLMGGLKICAGDIVIDCTVRQKIVKLIEQLNIKEKV